MISFHVDGDPKGQPRARARYKGRKGVYTPATAKRWIRTVEVSAGQHRPSKPITGAVRVSLFFAFKRPRSHYGTGRNAARLKESASVEHTQKPDLDNLEKLVLDCLTRQRFWGDDTQVVEMKTTKRWTETTPGVWIHVEGER